MNELNILNNEEVRINSVELVELINKFRKAEGNEKELKHKTLLRDIRNARIINTYNFKESKYTDAKGEKRLCYKINKDGIKYLADQCRGVNKKGLLEAYKLLGGDFDGDVIVLDRFETSFFNKLIDALKPLDIHLETQKQVLNKYRLDGFIEAYNLVIEYDEQQHYYQPQKSKDKIRQHEIEECLNYRFIRLDYRNTDSYNIGLVIKEIFSMAEVA